LVHHACCGDDSTNFAVDTPAALLSGPLSCWSLLLLLLLLLSWQFSSALLLLSGPLSCWSLLLLLLLLLLLSWPCFLNHNSAVGPIVLLVPVVAGTAALLLSRPCLLSHASAVRPIVLLVPAAAAAVTAMAVLPQPCFCCQAHRPAGTCCCQSHLRCIEVWSCRGHAHTALGAMPALGRYLIIEEASLRPEQQPGTVKQQQNCGGVSWQLETMLCLLLPTMPLFVCWSLRIS
jgi:hypothetical protein